MNILIIQTGFLGDAVLATGLLRGIATRPEIHVGMVVRAAYSELFENHPALHWLHPFQKQRKGGFAEVLESIRNVNYDVALIPHRSARSGLLAWRAGIPRRIGFRQSELPLLLTDSVEYQIAQHETDRNAALLERAGIFTTARRPYLHTSPHDFFPVLPYAAHGCPLVLIAPGSVWPTKRWGAAGYAAVARQLTERGAAVKLIGSDGERELCAQIAAEAGLPDAHNLAGKLTLRQLAMLIAMAAHVVTNDSAPVHLAEALGTPVTAIFGPTVPEFGFAPKGEGSSAVEAGPLPCRPCDIHGPERCLIGTHQCMTSITPAMILTTISIPTLSPSASEP
ncbi:MAG: glycosyltransferase family 9 protein [Armatimonadetes bacterium]|nr:glycosyltransferase family 9 protein [Armatimonadota bacterium]